MRLWREANGGEVVSVGTNESETSVLLLPADPFGSQYRVHGRHTSIHGVLTLLRKGSNFVPCPDD